MSSAIVLPSAQLNAPSFPAMYVCRAVPSRRKKGSDPTKSMIVCIPRHILPSPPSSALGSDPPTHPSVSSSHPSPILPAARSPYGSVSVSVPSTNPQTAPFCLDNPTSLVPMQHERSLPPLPSPPEGTASSDTISVGNLQLPISISPVPNINTTAFPAPPQPNNPSAAPYTMTSSSPKLTQDYSQTGGSSQETRISSSSPPDACNASYTADPLSTLTPSYSSPRPHQPPPLGVTLSTNASLSTTSQTHQCPTSLLKSPLTLTTASTCRPTPSAPQYGHFTSAGGSTSPVIAVNYPITHPRTTPLPQHSSSGHPLINSLSMPHTHPPQDSLPSHPLSTVSDNTLAPRPTQNNNHPFRIVWGTQRRCTAPVVHKAICALLPNHMWSSTTVKSSLRQRGPHLLWWHTIIAPSAVMDEIDKVWHILEAKTSWSLQNSLSTSRDQRHRPAPPTSQSQISLL